MTNKVELTSISENVQQIADTVGVDASAIKTQTVDWLKFMEEGVVVSVHIRYWRMKTKLTLEDLGMNSIDPAEVKAMSEIMSVGEKYLQPLSILKAINSADTTMRQTVKKHGYSTYYGQFIPATALDAFLADFEKCKQKILDVRDDIDNSWAENRRAVLDNYAVQARSAFRRAQRESVQRSFSAEDSFVDAFMQRIMNAIPSRSTVFDSFQVELEMNYIPLPSALAADKEKAALIEETADNRRAESQAVLRMKQEMARRAQSMKEEMIEKFRTDVVGQLQSAAYNAAVDVLETLKRNDGALIGPSVKQLRNMVQTLQNMNFFADTDVEAMIAQVKSQIDAGAADQRDSAKVQRTLQDIATITRSNLISLGQSARSAREVEIPDMPAEFTVRQARKNLGLTVEESTVMQSARAKRTF